MSVSVLYLTRRQIRDMSSTLSLTTCVKSTITGLTALSGTKHTLIYVCLSHTPTRRSEFPSTSEFPCRCPVLVNLLSVCFEILFTNMNKNVRKYTSYCSPRNQLPSQHQPSMTASEREELRRRLMEVRRQRREAPTVVFFGDASYGPSMRGHNAIPKKGLLRELCHRGLTFLLDEYKTSKMCPCGHDELKTTGYRFRAHKSDGAALCDLRSLSLF